MNATVELLATEHDAWNRDYSADFSVEGPRLEKLTVTLDLESERTWYLGSDGRLSPLRTSATPLWPAGRFIVTDQGGALVRWEFPRFGRPLLHQRAGSVRIVAPIIDLSRCGLSVWPNAQWIHRTEKIALRVSRTVLSRLEDCAWVEPYPDGSRAVICLTDHADFDSPAKARLLADAFVSRDFFITKSVFPAADLPSSTPWEETGLDNAQYRQSIDRLFENGSEIAAHGFTPKRDAPTLTECKRRLEVMRQYRSTSWIDHGTGDYLFSRGGKMEGGLDLATLLEDSGIHNYWSYFDVWDNPFGSEFSVFTERRGRDTLTDLVDSSHGWMKSSRREAAWFALHAFRNFVGDGNDISIRRHPWSAAAWQQALKWYQIARRVRRGPFGIYGRDGAVFHQSLESSWVFDTVLLNHLALQLSPDMIDRLIQSGGLLVAHCYMSCEHDYARRNVFKRTNGRVQLDSTFEATLDYISDRQRAAEVSTLSFAQLRQCLSLFTRADLRRTETGWRCELPSGATPHEARRRGEPSRPRLTFALPRNLLIGKEHVALS